MVDGLTYAQFFSATAWSKSGWRVRSTPAAAATWSRVIPTTTGPMLVSLTGEFAVRPCTGAALVGVSSGVLARLQAPATSITRIASAAALTFFGLPARRVPDAL